MKGIPLLLPVVAFSMFSGVAVLFSIHRWPIAAATATFYACLFLAAFLKELR